MHLPHPLIGSKIPIVPSTKPKGSQRLGFFLRSIPTSLRRYLKRPKGPPVNAISMSLRLQFDAQACRSTIERLSLTSNFSQTNSFLIHINSLQLKAADFTASVFPSSSGSPAYVDGLRLSLVLLCVKLRLIDCPHALFPNMSVISCWLIALFARLRAA